MPSITAGRTTVNTHSADHHRRKWHVATGLVVCTVLYLTAVLVIRVLFVE